MIRAGEASEQGDTVTGKATEPVAHAVPPLRGLRLPQTEGRMRIVRVRQDGNPPRIPVGQAPLTLPESPAGAAT